MDVSEIAVTVERGAGTPLSRQIEGQLRDRIRRGRLPQGLALPSTRALAEDLGVSRGVVVRAYTQLAAEGWLDVHQGATPRVKSAAAPALASESTPALPRRRRPNYRLLPAAPDLAHFPRRQWLASLRAAVEGLGESSLEGLERGGILELREELAAYLLRSRGVPARPENVVVTTGLPNGLGLVAFALRERGAERLAVEMPSARGIHRMLRRLGLEIDPLPAASAAAATRVLAADPAAVVMSPTFRQRHPLLEHERVATAVAAWARNRHGLIVDVDRGADWLRPQAARRLPWTGDIDHVISVGTVGATLSPAVRLGWLLLPPVLVEAVVKLQETSSTPSGTEQLALADFLRRGELDRHLRRMRKLNRSRHDRLVEALREALPETVVCSAPAGLHVMVEVGSPAAEASVARSLRAAGYEVETLSQHSLETLGRPYGVLIGYGCLPEPAIAGVVRAVSRAVRDAEPYEAAA